MDTTSHTTQEAAEDLFFGQTVIIWARWFSIAACAITTLWTATTISELTINTLLIIALMALNFFLHGRYLMERPVNQRLLIGVSALDLLLISATISTWQAQTGLASPFFVLLYPIVLAFAFVFPPRLTALYTGGALLLYTTICLVPHGLLLTNDELKLLLMRLITLASMGGLGTYYWRIQRRRRHTLAGVGGLAELQQHVRANVAGE